MSWDALIFNGQDVPASIEDVPNDWRPNPLGNPEQIKSKISSVLTNISWDEAGNGKVESPEFAIEFHIAQEEQIDTIGVRIVGDGDPIPILVRLCRTNGWVIFDNQAGDLINFDNNPSASWHKFTEWRDRVINMSKEDT